MGSIYSVEEVQVLMNYVNEFDCILAKRWTWSHRTVCMELNELPCSLVVQCFFPHAGHRKDDFSSALLNPCSLWKECRGGLPLSSSYSTHYCWGTFLMLPAQLVRICKLSFILSALTLFIMDKRRVRILTRYLSDWKGNINTLMLDCIKLTSV